MGGVDDEEEALGGGQGDSVRGGEDGGVEEFAAFAAGVVGGEREGGVEGGGAEVVDFHVAGHGKDVEGTVELGHGFVEEGGDDASVDVAGRTLVEAGEVDGRRGCDVGGVI